MDDDDVERNGVYWRVFWLGVAVLFVVCLLTLAWELAS